MLIYSAGLRVGEVVKLKLQELLGHKSSKTTEIYTHVSNKDIGKIKSPLDNLFEKENGGGVKG